MIVVSQDITERKRTERRLEKSRLQLRALSARLQSLREEERSHLAREIHDHLGQLLTALKLDLRSIERKLPALGDEALIASLNGKLASARELTDETIKSIQQIASELRPAILDRLGLEAAIDSETQAFQSRTGIRCESQMPPTETATAPELATAVYRIFQEILTNIARHAHAAHVHVRFSRDNGSLVLEVKDDGVGMQTGDLENPKSLGLLGMQERAEILGGWMLFEPGDGKGTAVTMSIPLNGKAGQES
jgi:signal transduction histidine kinase